MRPAPIRRAAVTAALLLGVLAPVAAAAPACALPLPLPAPTGAESLITEGVTIEGPLINNLGLPTLK